MSKENEVTLAPEMPEEGRKPIERAARPEEKGEPRPEETREHPIDELLRSKLGLAGTGKKKGRRLVDPEERKGSQLSPRERLQILDLWERSALPAGDFAPLVGISKYTLYAWRKKFEEEGPAGLEDRPRPCGEGKKLSELTRRTILMLKKANPEWGCEKISHMLLRGPALAASPSTVVRVLKEEGYVLEEVPTRPNEPPVRRFERAKPNQLWQTDLFTFVLKRQGQRLYLVGFLDDHSRFVVGYGLYTTQSTVLTLEVLRAAIGGYGKPEEILTDNGAQFVTWRGKSAFTRELEKQGIKQIVARPKRPQTLGKIERFWGSLWRELLETAIFQDLTDARRRIGFWIDAYNFRRPHQGLEGLVPADRFFGAESAVRKTLDARVASNALELARDGLPKAPFYLTGKVGDREISVHAEGEKLILTGEGNERQEIELTRAAGEAPQPREDELPVPVCPDGSPEPGRRLEDEASEAGEAPRSGGERLAFHKSLFQYVETRSGKERKELRLVEVREAFANVRSADLDEALLVLEILMAIELVPRKPEETLTPAELDALLIHPKLGHVVAIRKTPEVSS